MRKIEIPNRLKKDEFRFCIIPKTKKKCFDHTPYKYNDEILLESLALNENYGVLCGYGNLMVLDLDDDEIKKEIDELNLPETFTITSGIKRKDHLYFLTNGEKKGGRIKGKLDFQGKGTYAIGCNSFVRDEALQKEGWYDLKKDIPIAFLSDENYKKIIKLIDKHKKTKPNSKPQIDKLKKTITKSKPNNKKFRGESHYLDRNDFLEKPTEFKVNDVIRFSNQNTPEIKVSSLDGNYINKSFDFNKLHTLPLLKKALTNGIITMKSSREYDTEKKRFVNRWIFLNFQKNDKNG